MSSIMDSSLQPSLTDTIIIQLSFLELYIWPCDSVGAAVVSKMVSRGPVWPARLRLHSAGGVAGHMTELRIGPGIKCSIFGGRTHSYGHINPIRY